jgi:hypothetical protein
MRCCWESRHDGSETANQCKREQAGGRYMARLKLVVLVPYRPNGGPVGERYRWLWDHVRPRLEAIGPVFTGEPRGETWARAEAVNVAAERAGKWDVALIGDCDTVPEEHAVRRAVTWVQDTGGAARPHGSCSASRAPSSSCSAGPRPSTSRPAG